MSETSSKKNSIFDKALLGTAGVLAIGMMALGPRGEDKPSSDNEEVAGNQSIEKEEGGKAPSDLKEGKSGMNKKVAAIQAELKRARQDNATLEAQLRKNKIALEMKKDKESGDPDVQALKKAKVALEAKDAELAKLKAKLASLGKGTLGANTGKAVDDASVQKEQLIKNLEKLLKEAKSGK
ncbi:MAG: hypothetical protein L7T84_17070 [Akkermansiaceae bacterium]|nr:hypothetical protein [Akkermansiaceae bacterium]